MFDTEKNRNRFQPFEKKIWLSSPTMHGEEARYVAEAIETNWVSTVGANINETERLEASCAGRKKAVALFSGTAALPCGPLMRREVVWTAEDRSWSVRRA